MNTSDTKTWLITGAGRGMGVDSPRPLWPLVTTSSPPAATPMP
jgi:hypothetical protein